MFPRNKGNIMKEIQKKNYTRRTVSDFTQGKFKFQLFGRWLIVRTILSLFYKIEFSGLENVPKDRKFIVAPNHISYFDPFLAGEAIDCPVSYMAKKELFENKTLAYLIDRLGAFAVNREKLEVSTMKTAINVFKTPDWVLGIFPQGGIRKNHKIEKVNKGFAVIAKQMKANILPIGLTGCENYNWIPFKGKLKVSVGEIISYNQEYDEIIDEWSRKISDLTNYEYIKSSDEKDEEEKQPVSV